MNCVICNFDIGEATVCGCGWEMKSTVVPERSTYQSQPYGLTKDEFGFVLYETINTIGGIMQCRKRCSKTNRFCLKAGGLKLIQQREHELLKQLPGLMAQLSPEDVIAIVQRYPWVTAC